ncbi:hypothetical protein V6U90_17155 [Micromonospora sp. CPCC 206060]|uniref:hypothetical protein n=1 Tax=Micromonospora sp. CPCC 206060 TaxID=3122406 RepID=UPI002FF14EDF
MIPQHYPLWLAQDLGDDQEPIVGMVIGWQMPQPDVNPPAVQDLDPVFVDEGNETGGSSVFVAVKPYFVAATRDEAVKALEAHVKPRREARAKEATREQAKRRREAEATHARQSAEEGVLMPAQAVIVDRLRPLIPKLAEVAGEAEWKLVKPRHIEVTVKRKTPVMEALSDWDQDLIKSATAVLGEEWAVTVRKPGFLRGLR